MSSLLVLGWSFWWTAAADAQEIDVVQDAGAPVDRSGTTPVSFRSRRPVGIHRILSTTTISGYGFSGYGETTERLCTTPCTMEVPNGRYRFRVDDNFLFGRRITVEAAGEPLAWDVKPARPGAGLAGIVLTGVGLGGLLGGGMMAALDDPDGVPLAAVSAPVSAAGLYLLVTAFADAKTARP